MRKRESKEVCWREEVVGLILGVVHCTWSNSILRKFIGIFVGFSPPRGFPRINLCVLLCGYACLSFSDVLLMVMLL